MAQLATLEAKMASIEVSLSSSTNTPRRRKGTSLGGGGGSTISARALPRPPQSAISLLEAHGNGNTIGAPTPSKEMRTALQDREAVIQNLRMQLGLGKMPRPSGTAPLDDAERPAAEQQLQRLKHDADVKRVQIRNLKLALDQLDTSDNIDARIRQAELEYALGREELQMLSLVEEARALQLRMDKSRPEANSLFATLQAGTQLQLQAVQATVGRWAASAKPNAPGMWIEWALDGEGLYRGDRILEVNGALLTCRTREELHKLVGLSGRCQLVVVRRRSAAQQLHHQQQQQQLVQSQEDNTRLQHRICYLEDQVKELLQTAKETAALNAGLYGHTTSGRGQTAGGGAHVTSISISTPSPPLLPHSDGGGSGSGSSSSGSDGKPQIFQRGSYITRIVDGRPVSGTTGAEEAHSRGHITKTIIKDMHQNGGGGIQRTASQHQLLGSGGQHAKLLSASKISINSDTTHIKRDRHREARRLDENQANGQQQQQPQTPSAIKPNERGDRGERDRERRHQQQMNAYIANGSAENGPKVSTSQSAQRHRSSSSRHSEGHYGFASYARSVEQLNVANGENRAKREDRLQSAASSANVAQHLLREQQQQQQHHQHQHRYRNSAATAADMRSVKSLDFDSDAGSRRGDVDYTSEPVAAAAAASASHRVRPMPPKKPLRLSLQRAQSLQTVEANLAELDRKRAQKRTHSKGGSATSSVEMLQFIENNVPPFHTASLGRNNYV